MTERELVEARSYSHTPELSKLREVIAITIPAVELYSVVGKRGRIAFKILGPDESIPHIAETARVMADTQNLKGERSGLYPRGYFRNGVYVYDTSPEESVSQRVYRPKEFNGNRSTIEHLFPSSKRVYDLVADFYPSESPLSSKFDLYKDYAKILYGYFSKDSSPKGDIRVELYKGYPIVYCELEEDLLRFSPYKNLKFPSSVRGFSFVVTRFTTPGARSNLNGTPFVACLESCPRQLARRLYESQIMFKMVVGSEEATPVFISKEPQTRAESKVEKRRSFEEDLQAKAKEKVLSLVISKPQAIPRGWAESNEVSQFLHSCERELFMRESSIYVGNWFSGLEVIGLKDEKLSEIKNNFNSYTKEAIELISEWPHWARTREHQLLVANYLSFFPLGQWKEARRLFLGWKGRASFSRSLGIPRTR